MSLSLNYEFQLTTGVIDHGHVISHLREVLNSFAAKSEYTKFYVGITGNLKQRMASHAANKTEYRVMCPIYREENIVVGNSFHNLERDAINKYREGIKHPDTGAILLHCGNGPGGSTAKNWLYILVG